MSPNPSSTVTGTETSGGTGLRPSTHFVRSGWWLAVALVPLAFWTHPLLIEYGYRDDYSILREVIEEPGKIIVVCISEGRLFYGILLEASFSLLNSVPALAFWRLFGALLLGLTGLALTWILMARFQWNRLAAATAGALLSLLPSAQLIAAWASCWPQAVAGLLALGSFAMADNGQLATGARRRLSFFGALMMLVVAAMTYQSNALLYVVPLAAGWLASARSRWRWLFSHLTIILTALAIAYLLSVASFHVLGFLESRRFVLDPHVIAKAGWFLAYPFREALSLYVLHDVLSRTEPWYSVMQLITAALAAGVLVRGTTRRQAVERAAGLALLVATAYGVSFVVVERWPTYRTIWPLTGVLLVTAIRGAREWYTLLGRLGRAGAEAPAHVMTRARARAHVALAVVAVISVGLASAWNVEWLLARPQAAEWARVRHAAADFNPARREGIFLLLPRPNDTTTPIRHLDEFGSLSADGDWVAKEMFKQAVRREHPEVPRIASRFAWQSGYTLPRVRIARVLDFRSSPQAKR